MKHLSVFGMIFGLLVLTGLVAWQGASEIIGLLMKSGWNLLWLTVIWLPCLIPTTESWRLLFRVSSRPPFMAALAAIWMGRSVNSLLPVATIGGEIIKARLMMIRGISGIDASASVLVDKTVQVLAVILWGLTGIGLLFYLSNHDRFGLIALGGFGVLTICVGGFVLIQRAGMFNILARIGANLVKSEKWDGISANARSVDELVLELYRNKSAFLKSVALKTLGLMLQTTEVWLACYLLGHPVSVLEALMLKSLTSTLSDIAFVIPNAYGIQEGAYILAGTLLGLSPNFALALSLATRIREVFVDVPGLIYWQVLEGRILLKKRFQE